MSAPPTASCASCAPRPISVRSATARAGSRGPSPEPPHFDPAEIYGVVSADDRIGFDAREIIARLVDGSRYGEFKPEWGEHITCGFARIWGLQVGIIANNGIIFSPDALKATHFIELCEQRRVPLLFLQNTTGYMVGSDSETAGIAKHGAKMVSAVANATVPPLHGADRGLLRGRELRHVRARLQPPVPVRLAEQPHRHDVSRDRPDGLGGHPPGGHARHRDHR